MKKSFRSLCIVLILVTVLSSVNSQTLQPYGQLPTKDQLDWQELEYYMFIHFGPNTFTDKEWGMGNEDPKVFNPTHLDANQWAATAKKAGMKGIIITAKHHDGFCLWPSKYSTHTVRESAWKNGKGDVLRELSKACKKYGLLFGVYLSPWDRNHPAYGTPEYNQIYANTLREVHENYGQVFEQWFDGANGEGPSGKKQEYDWPLFHKTVLDIHPHCIMFSDVGPGCRWVGNERGYAGVTNWSTLNVEGFTPGAGSPPLQVLNKGVEDGEKWVPAECDVSIRPGWFYSPSTDDQVKSLKELTDIYFASVGRNGNFLLNVPVDREGLIHPNDSTRLMEFRQLLDAAFARNLILNKIVQTSSNYSDPGSQPNHLTDGKPETFWAAATIKAEMVIPVNPADTFNVLSLEEYLPLGQRVKSFAVDIWKDGQYQLIARQTTIGHKRLLRFPALSTDKIRIRILDGKDVPVLREVELYYAKDLPN
ncbi:MAG: alpha-L-fucosidase [Saprospiraceae bacterium]|nr:alpha-L-fucosidase [Saprospiraceae bacterium]